jgi:hypothetical protein
MSNVSSETNGIDMHYAFIEHVGGVTRLTGKSAYEAVNTFQSVGKAALLDIGDVVRTAAKSAYDLGKNKGWIAGEEPKEHCVMPENREFVRQLIGRQACRVVNTLNSKFKK